VTVKELEELLAAAQTSEDALSQELEAAQDAEMDLQARFEKFQDEFFVLSKEAERHSSTIASLEEALELNGRHTVKRSSGNGRNQEYVWPSSRHRIKRARDNMRYSSPNMPILSSNLPPNRWN